MAGSFEVHHLEAQVHGRYLIRAADSEGSAPLLVGFHGYAQTAEEHLDALLELPGLVHWHLVAIQGLHPFYRARGAELGASWMTRQDRDLAIADNIRYVSAAIADAKRNLDVNETVALFGFSQGTAMAYRAAASSGHDFAGLVALGGDVPSEILAGGLDGFPRVLIGRGDEDTWYDANKLQRDLDLLEAAGVEPQSCLFQGGHEFTGEFNRAAGRFLNGL